MQKRLIKRNYPLAEKDFIANQFIIGNGRLGYRGTLEEDSASARVTFNVVGVYDQYQNKWRESLNVFNPLYLKIESSTNSYYGEENALDHELTLDIEHGVFSRATKYQGLTISAERFIHKHENIIASQIKITSMVDQHVNIASGIDTEVYEINGPHYQKLYVEDRSVTNYTVHGVTNEGNHVFIELCETWNLANFTRTFDEKQTLWRYEGVLKAGETLVITKLAAVRINDEKTLQLNSINYEVFKAHHRQLFRNRFNSATIKMHTTVQDLEFYINYSIYHLLILENDRYVTSIPARGLSGQVYKGAIFWDTEIFMLPFYLATNPRFARNLIMYRINTLTGAKNKAESFGYEGAFYAWESQEDGRERCSLYNVTDAETGIPIRTYFADKQIHISADVIYGLNKYLDATSDYSILEEGGLDVFIDVYKFYKSYAIFEDGSYHFLDVVGPDEYHERVNDNAFTNYQIKYSLTNLLEKIRLKSHLLQKLQEKTSLGDIDNFLHNIYLPMPNENGVIEQFSGYYALKDIDVVTLKQKIKNPMAYLGGEKGLATKTRVIKQADVICLLALYPTLFSDEIVKANYDFYAPYTEHGSSLSNAMYGLVSARLDNEEAALHYLTNSAKIDLTTTYKLWAGGIFIGGTHPASAGGTYLIVSEGFCGLRYNDGKMGNNVRLPAAIHNIEMNYYEGDTLVKGVFSHD